jgi:hypothetical protein
MLTPKEHRARPRLHPRASHRDHGLRVAATVKPPGTITDDERARPARALSHPNVRCMRGSSDNPGSFPDALAPAFARGSGCLVRGVADARCGHATRRRLRAAPRAKWKRRTDARRNLMLVGTMPASAHPRVKCSVAEARSATSSNDSGLLRTPALSIWGGRRLAIGLEQSAGGPISSPDWPMFRPIVARRQTLPFAGLS